MQAVKNEKNWNRLNTFTRKELQLSSQDRPLYSFGEGEWSILNIHPLIQYIKEAHPSPIVKK